MSWAAHELESYVIQRHFKTKVSYPAVLLGCLAPDLLTKVHVYNIHIGPIDIGAPKHPWLYHRGWPGVGFTHTLFFGVVIAALILWVFKTREWALGILVGTAAHVLTDMFDSVGTMVFFPFTTQHYSTGMWAYAAQQGRYGDAAAYYSSLGGVWDLLWLVIALVNYESLTRRFFLEKVAPSDPFWAWLRRRFHFRDRTLLAIYRAYFFYGGARIFAWFLWARLIEKAPVDFTWGGPYWVNKATIPSEGWQTMLRNTTVGIAGFALLAWLSYRFLFRPLWRRTVPYSAPVEA